MVRTLAHQRPSGSVRHSPARSGAALALAAILGVTALTSTPPAQASTTDESRYAFGDTAGTEWRVPSGVSRVSVALRGGNGGAGANGGTSGGEGAQLTVEIDVRPGDVLTVFAATKATGKKDQRDGGKGYLTGGTGGKGSLTAEHAGGGGGAAAVTLNGTLIAVAGGGGGGGGSARYTDTSGCVGASSCKNKKVVNDGGIGGSAASWLAHHRLGDGDHGSGKDPGSGGAAGTDNSSMKTYHSGGAAGSSAGFGTDGGGGGGGGAGWPASGLGGGGGRKAWGSNGGGGGGAGMSWMAPGVREVNWRASFFDSSAKNLVRVGGGFSNVTAPSYLFIPDESRVRITTDGAPLGDRGVWVRLYSSNARTGASEPGDFVIYEGDRKLAEGNTYDYQNGTTKGQASLFLTNAQQRFTPGEHQFRVEFTPQWGTLTSSSATLNVAFPGSALLEEGDETGATPPALPEPETDGLESNDAEEEPVGVVEPESESEPDPSEAAPQGASSARSVPDYSAVARLLDSTEGPAVLIGAAALLLSGGVAIVLLLRRRARLQHAGQQIVEHDEPKPQNE